MRQFVTTQVVRNQWPVVSLSAYTAEIEQGAIEAANGYLAAYGLSIRQLGNFDISVMEEDLARLKNLTRDVKYAGMAGGYSEFARTEMMRGAAQGMAEGEGGAQMPMIIAGMGAGQMMGQGPPPGGGSVPETPQMVPNKETSTHECEGCKAEVADGAKFCPSCGAAQAQDKHCTNCGAKMAAGAKFCAECGTAQAQGES